MQIGDESTLLNLISNVQLSSTNFARKILNNEVGTWNILVPLNSGIGVAQSIQLLDYELDGSRLRAKERKFFLSQSVQTSRLRSGGNSLAGRKTRFYLTPRLRMHGAVPPLFRISHL
jgi:hypothetical protein